MSTPRPIDVSRRAMTLLEVILAMSLLVVLSSMTYWFYSSSLNTRAEGMEAARKLRLVRVVLDRIATEVRQVSVLGAEEGGALRGGPESIRLTTLRVPSRELAKELRMRRVPPPAEYDVVKVAYHILRHPEIKDDEGYERALGLARLESRVPRSAVVEEAEPVEGEVPAEEGGGEGGEDRAGDPLPLDPSELDWYPEEDESTGIGAASEINWQELYAPEIRYLRFCYFDGNKWWDEWDIQGENPLPQLVMVTIGFEGCPRFGEEFGETPNEEFCECLGRDPVDCVRLTPDQFSRVIRVAEADPLFRSRVTREGQDMVEQLGPAEDEEAAEEGQEP